MLKRISSERQPGEPFVFTGRDHGLMALRRLWDRLRTRTGIKDVTLHDIRRTMASWAVSNGVDVYVVSQMLAHSDVRVTQRHYGHLMAEAARRGFDRVPGLIEHARDVAPVAK